MHHGTACILLLPACLHLRGKSRVFWYSSEFHGPIPTYDAHGKTRWQFETCRLVNLAFGGAWCLVLEPGRPSWFASFSAHHTGQATPAFLCLRNDVNDARGIAFIGCGWCTSSLLISKRIYAHFNKSQPGEPNIDWASLPFRMSVLSCWIYWALAYTIQYSVTPQKERKAGFFPLLVIADTIRCFGKEIKRIEPPPSPHCA